RVRRRRPRDGGSRRPGGGAARCGHGRDPVVVSTRVSGIAHWDEVEGVHAAAGHLDAVWRDLGSAADTSTVGLQRITIAPGRWSTPAHIEHAEEEIFCVLGGSGLAWQDE